MKLEYLRELVNQNLLRVEMSDAITRKEMLVSPKTDIDPITQEEIKENKEEIIKYIRDLEKGKDRIAALIRNLKLLKDKLNDIPFEQVVNNPYEKLDINKLEDLNKAIELAIKNKEQAYLYYFAVKKTIMVDIKPTPREMEMARIYNFITEMCRDYSETYNDFWFYEIGGRDREKVILLKEGSLNLLEEEFNKEITDYCECKGYDLSFSHL